MKRLILVRHGKSSWEHNLPDRKRPLKKRAYRDAGLIIKAFLLQQEKPQQLLTSYAVRALETAKLFQEGLTIADENFEILPELYTFDSEVLIDIIRKYPTNTDTLMVFGHNPAITETANLMGDQAIENVPTTGLVCIDFDVTNWKKINQGKTVMILFPKMFN